MNARLKVKGNGMFKVTLYHKQHRSSLKLHWFCKCGNARFCACMWIFSPMDLCMSFLCSVGSVHIAENIL